MSEVAFVGNVPYNMGEARQLIDVLKSVGQVVGFRLVFDRETGKSKGYSLFEFADYDTAMSAVRNLNGADVGGRPLRMDLADSDPFPEGKTTVRGEITDSGGPDNKWQKDYSEDRRQGSSSSEPACFANLPPGAQVPPGSTALDTISQSLASMEPSQPIEVLVQMKVFIIIHPEQAKALLVAHPQLAHALFQALLLNNIVDSAVLQPPMQHQHMPPPQGMYGQPPVQQSPPPQPYYRGPAPQAPPRSVPPQVKDLGVDSTHQVGDEPQFAHFTRFSTQQFQSSKCCTRFFS
ncbi:hinge domain of cleavage stimulation factor subunit 2-domain-containing protein [Thelephora terrestris]|uniref:Hinge domain of cleavage stimulation factor subunit 2-domain-containing protein n=1 Tax=Thelephora terrestris TaxID=56493 RepID=A0A9P6HAU8_9AGAM|nr:hinge domain of cleavage stimulation factor subunit 2-domain-containing protein [Thelephora terrestris]